MRRRRRNGKQFWVGVAVGLLSSLGGLAVWWAAPLSLYGSPDGRAEAAARLEPVHVLVLGVDERSAVLGSRTDTMMLVRVEDGQARILSIPRDTLVDLEEHGEGKANSAYTYGGAELAKRTVSRLLDVPVDYHVTVDLKGFSRMVDLIGGVEYNVPKVMRYYDPTDGTRIDLKPGQQVLNGDKALQFVRFRYDDAGDDMGRIQRQHEFLKAAASQALTASNLTRIPQLIMTARQYVETDVPLSQQISLAQALYRAQQQDALVQETLPGQGEYIDDISFYVVDEEQLAGLLASWQGHP